MANTIWKSHWENSLEAILVALETYAFGLINANIFTKFLLKYIPIDFRFIFCHEFEIALFARPHWLKLNIYVVICYPRPNVIGETHNVEIIEDICMSPKWDILQTESNEKVSFVLVMSLALLNIGLYVWANQSIISLLEYEHLVGCIYTCDYRN